MTELDDDLVPEVLSIVNEVGKDVVFHDEPNAVDVATGRTSGTPTSWTAKVTPPSPVKERLRSGDVVRTGEVSMMLAASGLSFTPESGQRVVIDSQSYRVVESEPIYSGEQICAYVVYAKK